MKKFLEKFIVFQAGLKLLAFLGQRKYFDAVTAFLTTRSALLNLALNKPRQARSPLELAQTWQGLMPPDAKALFPIKEVTENTAYVEIHLHCPLRGTGDSHACHKLMNYDRTLMNKVGGNLVVVESQSNSGKEYCKLAIRNIQTDISDLKPAWVAPRG